MRGKLALVDFAELIENRQRGELDCCDIEVSHFLHEQCNMNLMQPPDQKSKSLRQRRVGEQRRGGWIEGGAFARLRRLKR